MSGNAVGLHEATSHLSRLAVGWGVSAFVANRAAWLALPGEARDRLGGGLRRLRGALWPAAEVETGDRLGRNRGPGTCVGGRRGRITIGEARDQAGAAPARLGRAAGLA